MSRCGCAGSTTFLLGSEANADAQNANVSTTLAHRTDEPRRRLDLFCIRILCSGFRSALEQTSSDVLVVNGWNYFGTLIAASCCVDRGIPMIVMSDSSRKDEPRTWWKEVIKRRIVGLYSAALVGGQRHVAYLVELGMLRDRIFTGYDVVDNAYFRRRAEEARGRKSDVRKKYGLPDDYVVASARFIENKELPGLIRAYAE